MTAGHLDVIERCARFFDEVHVVVAVNAAIVKDVARHGGDVTGMVPDGVVPMLDEALSHERGE